MEKAKEYRDHAAECLALAQKTPSDDEKTQLLRMAEVWESLAAYREQRITEF
jgi:hypothetical protein